MWNKPTDNADQVHNQPMIASLFEFTSSLSTRLSSSSSAIHKSHATTKTRQTQDELDRVVALVSELRSQINTLLVLENSHSLRKSIAGRNSSQWEKSGIELWNLCARLNRDHESYNESSAGTQNTTEHSFILVLALARLLAFLFVIHGSESSLITQRKADCANARDFRFNQGVRLLKIANKATRSLLQQHELDLASKVLEHAARYENNLAHDLGSEVIIQGKNTGVVEEDKGQAIHTRLRIEYFALRITLAWKQSRLDMAEVMFSNLTPYLSKPSHAATSPLEPSTIEALVDLTFEIGKDALQRKDCSLAVQWLERAYGILSMGDVEGMSVNATELRCSVIHYLVRALLGLQTKEDTAKAADLVTLLDNDYGGKLFVLLLQIEVLSAGETMNAEQYYSVLHRMIRTVHLTDTNFKIIIHHVHKLKEHSLGAACRTLDDLLTLRLHSADNQGWIERAFITRIWVTTQTPASDEPLRSSNDFVISFAAKQRRSLTASATHAAHTLFWKTIEETYKAHDYEATEGWCHLCLHKIFDNAGEINRAKITRRLISCCIARKTPETACQIFNQMPEATRNAPLTRYLMYKVALQDNDTGLAAECLESIASQPLSKDVSLIYACVLQAQHAGNKHQAIAALQKILSSYGGNNDIPRGVHLPALLRCTARLLMSELEEGSTQEIVASICNLFDGAAAQVAKRYKQPKTSTATVTADLFTDVEVDWFARNAYNIVLKFYGEWSPKHIMLMLDACIVLITGQSAEKPNTPVAELRARSLVCHALAAHACIHLARAEEDTIQQPEQYLRAHNHAQAFRKAEEEEEGEASGAAAQNSKNSKQLAERVLRSDFEAVLHLKVWDELRVIVESSRLPKTSQTFEILTDMLLASQAPASVMLDTLDSILTASSTTTTPISIPVLARYLRIFYALSVSSSAPEKTDVIIARTVELASSPDQYPAEELEWMATTTFNRAVDAYCAADEAQCTKLAQQAVEVAECLKRVDGGELSSDLLRRAGLLVWEV